MARENSIIRLIKQIQKSIESNTFAANEDRHINELRDNNALDSLIDVTIEGKCTLLMHYVRYSNLGKVRELLTGDNKASVLIQNENKETALFLAVKFANKSNNYDIKILTMLLEHSPQNQVILTNKENITPLHLAVSYNRADLVTKLLNQPATDFAQLLIPAYGTSTPLWCAANKGFKEIAEILLQHFPDKQLLCEDNMGSIPLFIALKTGNTLIAELLLTRKKQEQLFHKNDMMLTTISLAIESADIQLLSWFISTHKEAMSILSLHDSSPLQTALCVLAAIKPDSNTYKKFIEIIKLILSNSDDKDLVTKNKKGLIPLSIACSEGYAEIADLLLQKVANEQLSHHEPDGFSAILSACYYGHLPVLQGLLKHLTKDSAKRYLLEYVRIKSSKYTALHIVANNLEKIKNYPQAEMIKSLLEFSPDDQLLALDHNGNTPLFSAVELRQTKAIETLISYSNQKQFLLKNIGDLFPLYLAAQDHSIERKFSQLLEKGPDSQLAIESHGWQAIHMACQKGNIGSAALMLTKHPDQINKANQDGWTPLHIAIFFNQTKFAKCVLLDKYNANRLIPNAINQALPIHMASEIKDTEFIATLLTEHPEEQLKWKADKGDTFLHNIAESNNIKITKWLFSETNSLNIKELLENLLQEREANNHATPLHIACNYNALDVAKIFVEANNNIINEQDKEGYTPLHYACIRGNHQMVDYLLSQGANQNIANNAGYTPLHVACEHQQVETVRILVQGESSSNTKVDMLTPQQASPLYLAIIYGCAELIPILIAAKADVNLTLHIDEEMISPLRLAIDTAVDPNIAKMLVDAGATVDAIILNDINELDDLDVKKLFSNVIKPDDSVNTKVIITSTIQPQSSYYTETSQTHSVSGRSILKKLGITSNEIDELEQEKKRKRINLKKSCNQPKVQTSQQIECTWFNKSLSSTKHTEIVSIISPSSKNVFCYLPKKCLQEQGYELPSLDSMHFSFNSKHIKKLNDKETYQEEMRLSNESSKTVTYTHELKVGKTDRILLFEQPSDANKNNNSACLYVGSRFIPGGLHKKSQIRSVAQCGQGKAKTVDFPLLAVTNTKLNTSEKKDRYTTNRNSMFQLSSQNSAQLTVTKSSKNSKSNGFKS